MFDYIKGIPVKIEPDFVVIDINGWGVKLSISLSTYNKIQQIVDKEIKLHTHMILREDFMELLGFFDEIEREAFILLNKVPGIGPRVGLSVLSIMDVGKLKASILNDDVKTLVTVPGIGKKTAQKIIIDLKDRIKDLPVEYAESVSNTIFEASEVLLSLGFSSREIQLALDDDLIQNEHKVEDIVKTALRKLSK